MSCDSPHRKQPIQCGYCSSCILRKQALAASDIKDETRYIVPDGEQPKEDTSLYLRNMLKQVDILRCLLNDSKNDKIKWESLTRRFPELDDIVDRTARSENLFPTDMQKKLIQLYENYVFEWDSVNRFISMNLLNQTSDDVRVPVQ